MLRHYENLPTQYTEIFLALKIETFQLKTFDIFLIFAQNIDCGYTLEPPRFVIEFAQNCLYMKINVLDKSLCYNILCSNFVVRSFFALNVTSGSDVLQQYVSVVDRCFKEYKLHEYYKVTYYNNTIISLFTFWTDFSHQLSLCVRKPTIWVPTMSDTYRTVQSQKMVRGWKFWIEKVEELYYPCSENKGADQLRSYCEADLRLCFRLCILSVFPCGG